MDKISTIKSGFYTRLEGLRGIAVLLVLVSHWVVMMYFPKFLFLDLGFWGVNIFFVLSGFLITEILLKSIYDVESKRSIIKRFYFRRLIRIFPIYYLVILLLAFFEIENTESLLPWSLTYSINLFGKGSYIFMHIWSLCVEEQFYLFWPFLLLVVPPKRHLHLMLGLIFLSVVFRAVIAVSDLSNKNQIIHSFPLACLDALVIGSLLAYIKIKHTKVFQTIAEYYFIAIAIALAFFLLAYWLPKHSVWHYSFGRLLTALTGLFLIAFGATDVTSRLGNLLENKMLRFLGRISYGVYLYHWVLFVLLVDAFREYWEQINFGPFEILKYQQYLGSFIFFMVLTIIVATLSYYVIEKPILKLKYKFA